MLRIIAQGQKEGRAMRCFPSVILTCVLCITGTAHAAVDEYAPTLGRSVRLVAATIGCGTPEDLQLMMDIHSHGIDNFIPAQLSAEGCRPFASFHGEIIDSRNGMVCILGIGNARCLWFPADRIEPARSY